MNAPHVKATGLLFSICAACAAFLLFVIPLSAEAARLVPFIPSETLNPDCGPNDPNCYVQPFVVQDEGVSMTNFARGLNFIGGGVQVTADNAGIISVRVTRGPVAVGEINWNEFRSSGIRLATSTHQVLIGANSTTSLAKLEVVGDQVIRGGSLGIGTTSPFKELSVVGSAWFTGTANAQKFSVTGSSGTSTFNGISGGLLDITGNSTSTFNRGIDIASGCFSINGNCLSNNASGLNRQVQFNNNGSFGAEAAFTYNPTNNTLNIDNLIADFDTTLNALTFVDATGTKATTTSFSTANLSVTGNSTSTFNKGINLSSGCFSAGGVCVGNGTTSPAGLNRQIQFNNNGVFGSDTGFTYNNNTNTLSVQNVNITGAGTTTLNAGLQATNISLLGNATSTAVNGFNLTGGCFSVNGTCVGGATSPAGSNRQIQFNQAGSFGADAGFTYNVNTNTLSSQNLAISGGATSTDLFATTASTSNLFATTARLGTTTIGSLTVSGSATTTFGDSIAASSVNLYGQATSSAQNGINISSGCFSVNGTCVGGGFGTPAGINRQIQFNNNGSFGADAGFTYNSNTSVFTAPKLTVSAGSTLSGLTFATSTGISATTTNSFATIASSTNLFSTTANIGNTNIAGLLSAANVIALGSTTLQNFTFNSATGTNITANNLSTQNLTVSGSGTTTFSGGISSARLQTTATSTISGLRVESGGLSISSLDCSTFANGGKLITNAQGVVACGNDVSGGGGGALSNENTALGTRALQSYTSGYWNTAVGYNALMDLTTGFSNTALGDNAMASTTSGHSNIGVGFSALSDNTTGFMNIAVGYNSLAANTIGQQNIGIGSTALGSNTVGSENVAIGTNALAFNSTGSGNTALGAAALTINTASINTAVGYHTLSSNRTGNENAAFGGQSLNLNVSGSYNSAFGNEALLSNINASSSSAFGYQALRNQISGGTSTAFGVWAGKSNVSGSGLTLLGGEADVMVGNLVNAGAIGYKAQVATSNALVLGGVGAQAVVVGIGTTTPFATLSLVGNIFASTTATSTFQGNGINITGGCFSVSGTCIGGGSGNPGGANRQVQFNQNGSFGGDAGFTYNTTLNTLTVQKLLVGASTTLSGFTFATSTGISATTTNSFAVNQIVNNLQVNGLSTTTFVNNGINLNGGCFAVRGSCVFGGDGGPATIAGLNRQIQYNKNGSFGADAEFTYFDTTDTLNTGNIVLTGQFSVPIADISNVLRVSNSLSVVGGLTVIDNRGVIANGLRVTGSATSSFNNGIDLNNGCLAFNGSCSQIITTDSNLSVNSVNVSDSYKIGGRNFISGTNESNTFIGKFAGGPGVVGSANTFIGYAAGSSTVNAGANVAIGYYAMANSSAGIENIAIGNYALMNTSFIGNANTAIGDEAMYNNTDGHHNSAIGSFALRANTVGHGNVAIGDSALNVNTSGFENVAIGYHAGIQNTTGSSNTFIGFNSGSVSPNNISKSIGIGWNASPGASNVVVFGAASLGNEVNVGIGTNTPLYRLQVKNLSGTDVAKFEGNNGTFCTLNSNSGLSCTSDERLKKDIVEISASSSLQSIMSLRPVAYHWLFEDGASSTHSGFIAQEVERVLPELITIDNESGYRALSTVGLIPILTNAMQEQQRIIDDLKIKLDGLATTTTQRDFVNGLVRASDKGVSIVGDVYIDGHVLLGRDSAGIAAIASGEISKEVRFNGVYNKKPVVVVTSRELLPDNISYYVTTNNESFTIVLSKPSQSKITFSWIAVEGAVEEVVDDVAPVIIDNATNTPQDVIDPPQVDNGDSNLIDTPPVPIDIPVDQVAPIVDVIQNADAQ